MEKSRKQVSLGSHVIAIDHANHVLTVGEGYIVKELATNYGTPVSVGLVYESDGYSVNERVSPDSLEVA